MIEQANLIYYSPTGTSRTIAHAIGDGIKINNIVDFDLTFGPKNLSSINHNALTIFTVPVYGGRLPATFLERINGINGGGSPCAIVVVYGNRHYDDALLELKNEVTARGFIPVAGAAFIGEHSYSRKNMPIAAGRPDMYDRGMAEHFGKELMDKINHVKHPGELKVPGNFPYKEFRSQHNVAPTSTEECTSCGECIPSCPTGAIYLDEAGNIATIVDKCTKCCACVKICPVEARVFDTPFTKYLFENFSERKLPEFFF